MTVEQEGVYFRIQNADDSDKSLETEEARVAGQDPYKGYPYGDGPIRIFQQRKTLHGQAGDVERYFNLMVAGSKAEINASRMERIGEGMVRIQGPDGAVVFGVGEDGVQVGGIRIDARVDHDKIRWTRPPGGHGYGRYHGIESGTMRLIRNPHGPGAAPSPLHWWLYGGGILRVNV